MKPEDLFKQYGWPFRAYLAYLAQAMEVGLVAHDGLPDGRNWDIPCERFEEAVQQLLAHGFIRRRFWFFGKSVVITMAGIRALQGNIVRRK